MQDTDTHFYDKNFYRLLSILKFRMDKKAPVNYV